MGERLEVLKPDGSLVKGRKPALDEEFTLEALKLMLLSRAFDERATAMQRQGRWGVYSPSLGQEAAVVGSCLALDPKRDWLVPQYRELAAYIHHGMPLDRLAAGYLGKPMHARIPDGVLMLPTQVALAAQLQHAAGLAWGLKLQKKDAVVMTYVGDGGSSEGDFHEALNLAGVTRAPIVFVLQNNQWAISTPRRLQSAAPNFAERAAGYGFPGHVADGNDLLAVYELAAAAIQRARGGEGPTLIELQTYRLSFHNTTDNPSAYQDPKDLEAAWKLEPIGRVTKYLRSLRMLDDGREEALWKEARSEVDRGVDAALAYPAAQPDQLWEHVYEQPPERVRRQRAASLGD